MKSQLDNLKKSIEDYVESIMDLDGQEIDLTKASIFRKDTFLHKDTEDITEEESAAFERENPLLFAFLVALEEKINKKL